MMFTRSLKNTKPLSNQGLFRTFQLNRNTLFVKNKTLCDSKSKKSDNKYKFFGIINPSYLPNMFLVSFWIYILLEIQKYYEICVDSNLQKREKE